MSGDDVRPQIFDAISRERDYQDRKRGDAFENPHNVAEWILIMDRELREAAQAYTDGLNDGAALMEILQVVAVGVACLEEHGVVERKEAR